jgi:hypothetical protein
MPNGRTAQITEIDPLPAASFPEEGGGVYQDVSSTSYRKADFASWRTVRAVLRSPAHAQVMMNKSAAPDRETRQVEGLRQAVFEGELPDGTPDELQPVEDMVDALREHPAASALLFDYLGIERITAVGKHRVTEVVGRCRIDRIIQHDPLGRTAVVLSPVPTAEPGPEGGFASVAVNEGYPFQAAFTLSVLDGAGVPCEGFILIAVESTPPHAVVPYVVYREVLSKAKDKLQDALRKFRQCEISGDWPGYVSTLAELQTPSSEDTMPGD